MTRDGSRLTHDDLIDALAQESYLDAPAGSGCASARAEPETPEQMLRRGLVRDPRTGFLLVDMLGAGRLTSGLVDALDVARRRRGESGEGDEDEGREHRIRMA
jgi:hypothetical protein